MTEPVIVHLNPADPASRYEVEVRFPREYHDDLVAALDESGVEHANLVEESATSTVGSIIVMLGGPVAIYKALDAFWHRHDSKTFSVAVDGEVIAAEGISSEKFEKLLGNVAGRRAENITAYEESVRRIEEELGQN